KEITDEPLPFDGELVDEHERRIGAASLLREDRVQDRARHVLGEGRDAGEEAGPHDLRQRVQVRGSQDATDLCQGGTAEAVQGARRRAGDLQRRAPALEEVREARRGVAGSDVGQLPEDVELGGAHANAPARPRVSFAASSKKAGRPSLKSAMPESPSIRSRSL